MNPGQVFMSTEGQLMYVRAELDDDKVEVIADGAPEEDAFVMSVYDIPVADLTIVAPDDATAGPETPKPATRRAR